MLKNQIIVESTVIQEKSTDLQRSNDIVMNQILNTGETCVGNQALTRPSSRKKFESDWKLPSSLAA